jgi:hypothetical protein
VCHHRVFFSLCLFFLVDRLIVAARIRTSSAPPDLADCNRTYYAEMGESYRLLVTWPKSNHLPFVCYLTFTSVTHDPAEILQVSRLRFDSVNVSATRQPMPVTINVRQSAGAFAFHLHSLDNRPPSHPPEEFLKIKRNFR